MKFHHNPFIWRNHFTRLVAGLVTLGVVAVAAPNWLRAEEKATELPPEISTKLDNFLKKLTDAQRKFSDKKMDALIEQVTKATGLTPGGVETLKKAAALAEDQAQTELQRAMRKEFVKQYQANGKSVAQALDQPQILQMAIATELPESPEVQYTRAPDQAAWKEAFNRTLTPEQAAAWAKASPKPDEAETLKAINTYLDAQSEGRRTQIGGTLLATCDNIATILNLPKERADAVTALANQAVDTSVAVNRKSTLEMLLKYDKTQRDRILKGQGSFFVNDRNNAPEDQAVWKDGLAKLLSDEERARLKTADEAHETRRVQALGLLLVKMMDEKVAFTQDQRAKLQGVAEKLVRTQKAFFPNKSENTYYRFEPSMFYKTAKDAKAEEVRPLLDAQQWKHWQEIANNPNADDNVQTQRAPIAPSPGKEQAPANEPEDMEAAVADYLVKQSDIEHKRLDVKLLLQAEDATRVAGLNAEATAHLRTAALGAAEAATAAALSQTESNLRNEIQGDATPENIQQKIAGMSRYSYSRNELEDHPIWKAAVETNLDEPQRQAWQAACAERTRYSSAAIAALVGAELDRRLSLTPDEWQRLLPTITQVLEDYGPDIRSQFSYYSYPWYLQSYTLYTPMHAVPDKDLKEILSPTQYKTWTGGSEYRYSSSYWENIRSNHDRRLKEKKS